MFSQVPRPTATAGRVLALTLMIVTCAAMALGQVTSGTIFGTVKDPSGAIVSGANVTVSNPATGTSRVVKSGDSGDFVVPNLLPGTYNIAVEAQGFKKTEKTNVVLSAADKLNAGDFVLSVGATTESVTVTADAGQLQLQSNSAERSDLVTGKQLNDVALNGRMVLDYMKLIPGVVSTFDGSSSGTGGLDAFNINGTRANEHEFTIDGSSNVDTGNNGGTHVTVNTDAIAEVKVLTSNYQAEFGKAGGGQIAVVTRSGSNGFHGDARWFHRHDQFNANNWFANQQGKNPDGSAVSPRPLYRYNYFGYQIGGPIKKDKLFFFFGQEYYRQLVPTGGLDEFRVPTALERQGDFSQTYYTDSNNVNHLLVVYDPTTGQPFPGNAINKGALPPAQQNVFDQISKILSLYPQPNTTLGGTSFNYVTQLSYSNPRREDILRLDYQINDKNRFYGRWINNSQTAHSPMQTWNLNCMGQLQLPGGCTNKQPSWNLALDLVTNLTPTLLNEVSLGPSVVRSSWTGANITVGQNGIALPMLFPVTANTSIPDLSFNGNTNIQYPWSYFGANPWFQANTTINFNDNLTWVKNNHTFKFGAFYQRSRKDQIGWGNYNGQFNFSNGPTNGGSNCPANTTCGDPYASALLGYFDTFKQDSARPTGYFRYNQLEFYAQDTWKVLPRLTLDYGMRFAWIPPQYDVKNQVAVFNPSLYDPTKAARIYHPAVGGGAYDPANPGVILDGSLVGSLVPNSGNPIQGMGFANAGYPRGGWDSRGIMPEPRLGFAYELTGDHKTVLRGGFGTSHDREQGNLVFNPVFSNPQHVITPTINNGNIMNLPNAVASGIVYPFGNIVGADKSGKVPVVYSFSLGVQRQIGTGTTVDIAYVGTLGRHLVTARNLNQVPYLTAFSQAAQDPAKWQAAFGTGVQPVEPNLPTAYSQAGFNYSGSYAYDPTFLVPYPDYGVIEYYKFDGTSNYNSLQASVQRRFSKSLTFGAVYTFSKALTTASADEDWQDTFFPRKYDYRLASYDVPHVLAVNYVYDLPSTGKHFNAPKWVRYLTDNYQLSGVTQFMSGMPIDTGIWWPPVANNINGTYNAWWVNWKRAWIYPIITGDVNHQVGTSKFNPASFQAPNIGMPVGVGRDLRGGGMQNWDMSIFKNIPLGAESRYLQLRLEAFNVFNHPNFQNVNLNWNFNTPSGTTGAQLVPNTRPAGTPIKGDYGNFFGEYNSQYSGVGGPRVLQMALKFYF